MLGTTDGALDPVLRGEFERILGSDGVVTDPSEIACAQVDVWWITRYEISQGDRLPRCQALVFPHTTAEVAAVVRLCNDRGVPVIPRGGGAGDAGGVIAVRGGIIVDTKRMDRILELNERSLTVRVQPGVIQAHLEEWLNRRGLTMNHFPASINASTVGGFIGTNGTGVLSSKYGKMTDMVHQLEVVLPTGSVFRSLPVNRHSSGPDLSRLFVGAEGTLGIVTEALLKVHPLPEKRTFVCLIFADLGHGIEAGRQVMVSGLRPSVMRFWDETDTEHILKGQYGLEDHGCFFLAGFDGPARVVDAESSLARETFVSGGGREIDDRQALAWWNDRLKSYYPPLDYVCEPWMTAVTDTVAPYEAIERVYAAMKSAVEDGFRDHGAVFHAHFSHWYDWGTSFYPTFLVKHVPAERDDALHLYWSLIDACGRAAINNGGALNEHHGIGMRWGHLMKEAYGEESFRLLEAIKRAVDPNGVMNPGKLGL